MAADRFALAPEEHVARRATPLLLLLRRGMLAEDDAEEEDRGGQDDDARRRGRHLESCVEDGHAQFRGRIESKAQLHATH